MRARTLSVESRKRREFRWTDWGTDDFVTPSQINIKSNNAPLLHEFPTSFWQLPKPTTKNGRLFLHVGRLFLIRNDVTEQLQVTEAASYYINRLWKTLANVRQVFFFFSFLWLFNWLDIEHHHPNDLLAGGIWFQVIKRQEKNGKKSVKSHAPEFLSPIWIGGRIPRWPAVGWTSRRAKKAFFPIWKDGLGTQRGAKEIMAFGLLGFFFSCRKSARPLNVVLFIKWLTTNSLPFLRDRPSTVVITTLQTRLLELHTLPDGPQLVVFLFF